MTGKENINGADSRVNPNDASIINDCLSGNTAGYTEIVQRYQRSVFNLAYRITGNVEDAQDISQEAFVKAYQSLHTFKPELSFKAWLLRITHNLAVDQLRARSRKPSVSMEQTVRSGRHADEGESLPREWKDSSPDPRQLLIQKEKQDYLSKLIQSLPDNYRTVIVLRHQEQLSIEEIAQTLSLPEGTVKIHLFRARQLLKEKMGAVIL